jgi:Stress responsive A/B Barrel Domain
MINHVVLMKFKPEVSEAEIRDLEKALDVLPNTIKEIKMFEFGRDALRSERSYDFALVSLFANLPALKRYQAHPDHLPVAARIQSMCSNVVMVDFHGADASAAEAGPPEWERDPWEQLKR